MSMVLDGIVLAILVVCVLLSARRGFVRTAIETVGLIAAIIITFTISSPLAGMTYDKMIEPSLLRVPENMSELSSEQLVGGFMDRLPSFLKENSEKFGLSAESLNQNLSEQIGNGAETAVRQTSQKVIRPIFVQLIGLVYSIVLMVVLLFVVKLVARLVGKLFSFSLVGTVNRTLGGILGVFKGIFYILVLCVAVSFLLRVKPDGFLIFSRETVNGSHLFRFFCDLIPLNS